MIRNNFKVSATHVHPDYQFKDTEVRVARYGNDELFYAVHPKLGCGRNAPTPERAIHSLFQSSACTVTSITRTGEIF